MIIRVVRMTFHAENTEKFQQIFAESQFVIKKMEGCQHLELWQDADNPCIFMTYSFWSDKQALENYRSSDFFKKTWANVKPLFSERPMAFSAVKK